MKKTVKTEKLIAAARVLGTAKIDKMQDKEKYALIRNLRAIKRVTDEYDALMKDASERLKPADFDALAAKEQAGEAYTPEEQATVRKYNADITACMQTELRKDAELTLESLADEAVVRLGSSNPDMPAGTVLELMELLCDDAAPEAGNPTPETE